jgi:hypothetical protein
MNTLRGRAGVAAVALAAVFGAAQGAVAADDEPLDCLQIVQIKNTKIIDDQNIVFQTRNNKFYNNKLPHKCGGLKSADKFRYKTSLSQLCNVDMITVLQGSGSSMMDGATCGLGMFTPTEDPSKAKDDKADKADKPSKNPS